MQNKNFITKSRAVYITALIGDFASWKFLAGTTAVLAYAMLAQFLSAHLTGWQFYAAISVGTLMVYGIVDAGIVPMLTYSLGMRKLATTPAQKKLGHIVTVILIFKIGATVTASLWVAPEMGEATTKNNEDAILERLLETDEQQHTDQAAALARLEQLEATEAERVAAAKKEGDALVKAAIAMGNPWQRDSYKKIGFSWLTNPENGDKSDHDYAAGIKAAQDRAAALVDEQRQKTLQAAQFAKSVADDTNYVATTTLLRKKADAERQAYLQRLERRKGYFILADVLALFFGLMFRYVVITWQQAAEIKPKEKTVGTILGRFWSDCENRVINGLEWLLQVDLNGDGTIGGKEPEPPQQAPVGAPPQALDFSELAKQITKELQQGYAHKTVVGFGGQRPVGDAPAAPVEGPPPPIAENRGTPVATGPHSPTPPVGSTAPTGGTGLRVEVVEEIVEDVDATVDALCGKIGRYYPARWNRRVADNGAIDGIAANIGKFLEAIDGLLASTDAPIKQRTMDKVERYRTAYQDEILPQLKKRGL